jgi:hypothetical protein
MNGQELATAVQYGLAIIVIVVNNGMYGTIRMHQEREYPERVHGTDLVNRISPPSRAPTAPSAKRSRRRPTLPRFRARAGLRQAGPAGTPSRSRGDHAADGVESDSGECAEGKRR